MSVVEEYSRHLFHERHHQFGALRAILPKTAYRRRAACAQFRFIGLPLRVTVACDPR